MSYEASLMLSPRTRTAHRGMQRGVALFVGLVFLVMLSLLALVVMKGTLLEMQMTTATARHEQAFEASEALRPIPEAVLADHIFNRGWPVAWGGTVPDALFDLNTTYANRLQWKALMNPSTTTNKGLQKLCGGTALVSFYLPVGPCTGQTDSYNYTPSQWNKAVDMDVCNDGTTTCGSDKKINGVIAVVRDGVTLNKGSGAAMSQGYASVGVGTAKGGSALLLQIRSQATIPGGAQAVTIAQYKVNIDH